MPMTDDGNGGMKFSGLGEDNNGKWNTTGTVSANNKVQLTMTYPDKKQLLFDGTLDKSRTIIKGYLRPKSYTDSFTITMS